MVMKRSPRLGGLSSSAVRAALYYARKRRLARIANGGSPPAPSGFQYWRLKCEVSGNASFYSFAEIEMRSSDGGADLTTTGQAIAGGTALGLGANLAFDNDVNTWWLVDKTPAENAWVGQNFGSPVDIVQLQITARSGTNVDQTPTQFTVDRSEDGITWTTEWTVSGIAAWGQLETRIFNKP